jgi:hypothetical protein
MKGWIITAAIAAILGGSAGWAATHGGQVCEPPLKAHENCFEASYLDWYRIRAWAIEWLAGNDTIIINAQFGIGHACPVGTPEMITESSLNGSIIENTDIYSPTLCLGVRENRPGDKDKIAPGEQKL